VIPAPVLARAGAGLPLFSSTLTSTGRMSVDDSLAAHTPFLDPNAEPLHLRDGSLLVVQRGATPFVLPDAPPRLADLLRRADGRTVVSEILRELGIEGGTEAAALIASVHRLAERGIVRAPLESPAWFKGALAERFQSYVDHLHGFATPRATGYDFFRRLRESHVVVIGMGGAGSVAAVMLAAAGVGQLTLVDGDTVEASNLIRQPFFTEEDATGRRKVDAVAAYLARFSSFTEVRALPRFVRGVDDARDVIRGADVIAVCADAPRFLLQRWINEACVAASIPYVNGFDKRVGPMWIPGRSACFECCEQHIRGHFPRHDLMVEAMQTPAGRRAPSAFVGPVLTGMIQANECIGYLTEAWEPKTQSRCATLNNFGVASYQTVPRLPDCPVCGERAPAVPAPPPPRPRPVVESWPELAREHWSRGPAVLRAGEPPVSEAGALAVIRDAFERQRQGYNAHLRVFTGDRLWSGPDVYRLRPQPSEHTVREYTARVLAGAGVPSLTVIVNRAHARAPELWLRTRRFLAPLFELTGVPDSVDSTLWLSTARETCFGVHDDPYHGFILPIVGARSFRVWPIGESRDVHFDPEEQAAEHELFSIERGEALYIPADRPHVGLSDGQPALQLTIAIDRRPLGLAELIEGEVAKLLLDRVQEHGGVLPYGGGERLAALAGACRDAIAQREALGEQITAALLRLSSAGGFRQVPPLRDEVELDGDTAIAAPEPAWLVTQVVGDVLQFAGNGHVFSLPAHPGVIALLERVRSGAAATVRELVDAFAVPDELEGDAIEELVGLLHRMRIVEIVGREGRP
jgi:molybdopterin-synthase adenylyltransferase